MARRRLRASVGPRFRPVRHPYHEQGRDGEEADPPYTGIPCPRSGPPRPKPEHDAQAQQKQHGTRQCLDSDLERPHFGAIATPKSSHTITQRLSSIATPSTRCRRSDGCGPARRQPASAPVWPPRAPRQPGRAAWAGAQRTTHVRVQCPVAATPVQPESHRRREVGRCRCRKEDNLLDRPVETVDLPKGQVRDEKWEGGNGRKQRARQDAHPDGRDPLKPHAPTSRTARRRRGAAQRRSGSSRRKGSAGRWRRRQRPPTSTAARRNSGAGSTERRASTGTTGPAGAGTARREWAGSRNTAAQDAG